MSEPSEPIDDGGQAFPLWDPKHERRSDGLSLRDYFAGQAIIGCGGWPGEGPPINAEEAAAFAYAVADALLVARSKKANEAT